MAANQNINVGTFIATGRPIITHHGRPLAERTEHGKFKSFFGASAEVCFDLWYRLDPTVNISRYAEPKHLLWALMLVKVYAFENALAKLAGCDEKTFRKWAWLFLEEISETVMPQVISLDNRFRDDVGNTIKMTVDGVQFLCKVCDGFTRRQMWAWKFKKPGVNCGIGICIRTGDIVWAEGSHLGPYHDLTMYRECLKLYLEDDEMVSADRGYRGDETVSTPYTQSEEEQEISKIHRARHETVNCRMKMYGALNTAFRHGIVKHGRVFRTVATLVQLAIEIDGERLFDVPDYVE